MFDPGARLATVPALAIDWGVHHYTVAEAYRQLADERWLELKRHRGAKAAIAAENVGKRWAATCP